MDKNKDAEKGDCVRIVKPGARYDGCIGRVTARIWYRGHEWVELKLPGGYKARYPLKNVIGCAAVQCWESDV